MCWQDSLDKLIFGGSDTMELTSVASDNNYVTCAVRCWFDCILTPCAVRCWFDCILTPSQSNSTDQLPDQLHFLLQPLDPGVRTGNFTHAYWPAGMAKVI